ncbi:viral A-type inclusion protein [Dyadobacter sandarakinus]|uniref:Viral A-type inclusion protein n=1 Tax=Dyadobacter sandarakinus TaxID=2747268 RepID=A0ABX7I644_9BACT|nr:viral A-type inclusion protein [Dyadobacter sandarakinus]QRR01569.1 viral A-type inclusion protein [Dyadobacter sandarakinus]
MKRILPLLLMTTLACSNQAEKDKVADLEAEVLAIHDEVMPQMDAIMSLKAKLSKKIQNMDSLQNEGISSNTVAGERIKAVDLNQKLSDADKLMMDWMHAYRGDSAKKLKGAEATAYFEKEREKILQVKQVTLKSVQDAKTFLE